MIVRLGWILRGTACARGAAYADDEWASRGQVGSRQDQRQYRHHHRQFPVPHRAPERGLEVSVRRGPAVRGDQGRDRRPGLGCALAAQHQHHRAAVLVRRPRLVDDKFSGVAYQQIVSSGAGYQFIKTDTTKLAAQIRVGARRLRPELLVKDDLGGIISASQQDSTTDAVLDAGATFEHALNDSTKLLAAAG